MDVVYLSPWRELQDPAHRQALQHQYDREIGAEHILWKTGGLVVGKCDANDDVLVALPDGRFVVVHLTWTSNPGGAIWPATAIYSSAEAVSTEIAREHADDL